MQSQSNNKTKMTQFFQNLRAGILTFLALPLIILMLIFPQLRGKLEAWVRLQSGKEDGNEDLNGLLDLLCGFSIAPNSRTVNWVLRRYGDRLNADLGEQLYRWSDATFAKVSPTEALSIATTLVNFSNRVRTFDEGDRTQHLKMAYWGYKAALIFYNRENFPLEWAKVQYNLGNIYRDLPEGNHSDKLTHAIAAFENALKVFTPEAYPQEYTLSQRQLMGAYQQKAGFQSRDRLEIEELNSNS
ncbi:MAG: hypothetical protein ACLFV6_06850 [Spirulinaceae cyanobacterium]